MNSTKRALALVAGASAVLAAGTIGATSAKAQLTNMLQSGIQRPTAGINIGTTTMEKGTQSSRVTIPPSNFGARPSMATA